MIFEKLTSDKFHNFKLTEIKNLITITGGSGSSYPGETGTQTPPYGDSDQIKDGTITETQNGSHKANDGFK